MCNVYVAVDYMSWYLTSNQRRFEPMMIMTPENWSRYGSRDLAEWNINARRAWGWSVERRREVFQDDLTKPLVDEDHPVPVSEPSG